MKKLTKILCLVLVLCFALTFALCLTSCSQNDGITNLIYIIGDGMGPNHIENTKLYLEKQTLAFEEYFVGNVTTHSANNAVTDSAAAGTALATGVKTNNYFVGIDPSKNNLQNILELSKKLGKKAGFVTTDELKGATPAAFSAHANDRDDAIDILNCQAKSKLDIMLGLYHANYYAYENKFVDNGYAYVQRAEDLSKIPAKKKVLGNIKNVASPYDTNKDDAVSLKSLTEFALERLSTKNNKGFTLMVEGAHIDKYSHSNDVQSMIWAMMDLADTVEYVLNWAKERGDTAVIFTADHETGGLQKANSKQDISNSLYTLTSHSATNVNLYLYNVTTTLTTFDNVDVYKLAKYVVTGEINKAQ